MSEETKPSESEKNDKCSCKCKYPAYHAASDKYWKYWDKEYNEFATRRDESRCSAWLRNNGLLLAVGTLLLLLNWDTLTHAVTNAGDWFAIERNNVALFLSIVVFYFLTKRRS